MTHAEKFIQEVSEAIEKNLDASYAVEQLLEIISSQKAEIAILRKIKYKVLEKQDSYTTNDKTVCMDCEKVWLDSLLKAKSEAYREYEGRVRMILEKRYGKGYMQNSIVIADLDNLTKELTRNLHETYTESKNDLEELEYGKMD